MALRRSVRELGRQLVTWRSHRTSASATMRRAAAPPQPGGGARRPSRDGGSPSRVPSRLPSRPSREEGGRPSREGGRLPCRLPRRSRALLVLAPPRARAQTHVAWSRAADASNGPSGGRAAMAYAHSALPQTSGAGLADVLWMYGGISATSPSYNYSSELWGYTAATGQWQAGTRANTPPPPLFGASMCSIGHNLWLYGGSNFAADSHDDLYYYYRNTNARYPAGPGLAQHRNSHLVYSKMKQHVNVSMRRNRISIESLSIVLGTKEEEEGKTEPQPEPQPWFWFWFYLAFFPPP